LIDLMLRALEERVSKHEAAAILRDERCALSSG